MDDDESGRRPPAMNPDFVGGGWERSQPPPRATSPMMVNTIMPTSAAIVPSQSPNVVVDAGTDNTAMQKAGQNMARYYTALGRNPTGLQCPHCGRQSVTTVQDMIGVGTVIAVIIIACLFWPICWLPLLIPSCKRTTHYCGHDTCRKKIGETSACA